MFHAAVIGTHGDECFADDKVSATDPDSEGERMRQRHRARKSSFLSNSRKRHPFNLNCTIVVNVIS